ncbi:MAG: (2Fe-2S)-binding protein [Deltaproteobacteria bacterium]|nr:(2Fe-2S)-binding protein [Deltaproteobacteria bacterium]
MGPEFIFAQDIEDLVREGKGTLEVGEGARISAAALDLIREHGVNVVSRPEAEITAKGETAVSTREAPGQPPVGTCPAAVPSAGPEGGPPAAPAPPVAEEELERIVDRVVARFKELRGKAPGPQAAATAGAPAADDDLIICRCEEITRGEIKEAIRNGMETVSGVKRITRAGMGLCQGQTCERLVAQILARELGRPAAELEPLTARAPVRPLPLSVFATG